MDDGLLRRRMWASLTHLHRQLAAHGEGGRLFERGDVIGSILTGAPESSIVNAALSLIPVTPSPDAVAAVAGAYREAGLGKWAFWIDPVLQQSTAVAAHGLVLDSTPAAMAAPLAELDLDGAPSVLPCDARTTARINDIAYGHGDDRMSRAFGALPASVVHGYRADDEAGEPVSVLMVSDHDGDATVWFVATVPWAQRQGHATRLLRGALLEARERGCVTTSLQASRAGRPVYQRLGYRNLGELELWERRP